MFAAFHARTVRPRPAWRRTARHRRFAGGGDPVRGEPRPGFAARSGGGTVLVGAGASRATVEQRRGRGALVAIGAVGLVLLSACTTDQGRSGEDRRLAGRGLSRGEEATIGAFLQQADDLQTRIAVATTAL